MFITSGRWVIFLNSWKPKAGESRGKGAVKFVLGKSCFWLWLWVGANPFGLLLTFGKAKVGWKAQPNKAQETCCTQILMLWLDSYAVFGIAPTGSGITLEPRPYRDCHARILIADDIIADRYMPS